MLGSSYWREQGVPVIAHAGAVHEIDQSPYMHLPTAGFLAKRNAGQVFQSMEFEFWRTGHGHVTPLAGANHALTRFISPPDRLSSGSLAASASR